MARSIVVTLRKTTFDLLEKALDTLRKARGRPLGIVLNKAPLRGADASPTPTSTGGTTRPSKAPKTRQSSDDGGRCGRGPGVAPASTAVDADAGDLVDDAPAGAPGAVAGATRSMRVGCHANACRRPRVALVSSSYAPYVGGVEEHVRQVARELRGDGVDVEVWTVDRGEALGVREVDGSDRAVPADAAPGRIARELRSRFLGRLPHAWRSGPMPDVASARDVLHVQCFGPNGVYALALHRRFGIPLVVTSHGETVADDRAVFARSALLRAALRRVPRAAVAVTAPSRFVIDDLRRSFGLVGGTVVPNGVEPRRRSRAEEAPALQGRYLLAVGRLGSMKGFDLLDRGVRGSRARTATCAWPSRATVPSTTALVEVDRTQPASPTESTWSDDWMPQASPAR